jgi:hypothetical protein
MALRDIGGQLRDAFNRFAGFKNPDGSETIVLGNTRHGSTDATPVEVRQALNRELRMLGARGNRHNTSFELKWSHLFSSSTDDNATRHMVVKLPDLTGVYAIAFRWHNTRGTAITMNGIWRTFDDIGDTIYNDATDWRTMYNSAGSADISVPARSQYPIPIEVVADNDPQTFYDVPGTVLTSPILTADLGEYIAFRTFGLDNTSRASMALTTTAGPTGTLLTHGIVASRQYGVNGIAVLTDYNTPVYSEFIPPVTIVCYTEHEVYSLCYFGGSTDSGDDDDPTEAPEPGAGLGFHNRMFFRSFGDGGLRVVSANSCDPGGSTAHFLAQLAVLVAEDNDYNEIAYRLRSYTDDDGDDDYEAGVAGGTFADFVPYMNRIKGQALIAIRLCARNRKTCRLILDHYADGMSGAEYEVAKHLTAWARDLAAQGRCKLNDKPARYNDETAAVGTFLYPEFMEGGDGPHLNGYGHDNETTELLALIRSER